MDVDFLIVGQGLAGSALAWRLLQRGQRVLVVDNANPNSATRVAAGLINPVTGQRLVRQAQAEQLLEAARTLYAELARELGRDFYHDKTVLRLFQDEDEQAVWERRKADPDYAPYLGERYESGTAGPGLQDPLGSFEQHRTGYLDTPLLLDTLKAHFTALGAYREANLEPVALQPGAEGVLWQDVHARYLIFCEGYRSRDNPWFSWLPAQPAKGEILTLELAGELPPQILKGKRWLLPLGGGHCKLGATYEWQPIDEQPSAQGQQSLLEDLGGLLATVPPVHHVEAAAGVRPGTRDKAPWLGLHPEQARLGILNGFGSKGSMLIPHYSACLLRHLLDGEALPAEADIGRHRELWDGCA